MREIKRLSAWHIGRAVVLILLAVLVSCPNPLTQAVRTMGQVAASSKIEVTVVDATSTAIANGGSYDFGTVGVSDPAATTSFTVKNTGKVALTISSSTCAGANAGCFSYKAPPPANLAPSASATFTIAFKPDVSGAKAASAVFATNDVSASTFSFNLTGIGIDSAPMPAFSGGNNQCIPSGITTVTITCSNPSATIYYTVDGSAPSVGAVGATTTKYTSPFAFNFLSAGTGMIRAMAVVTGMTNSSIVTANFSTSLPAAPSITVNGGPLFLSAVTPQPIFSISSTTTNAAIAFTIDGTTAPDPTSSPVLLTATPTPPYPIASAPGKTYLITNGSNFYCALPSGSVTLKAVAFVGTGTSQSPLTTSVPYTFQLSTPTFSGVQPLATYYAAAQTVTLACANGGGGTATMTYSTSTTGSLASPPDVSGATYTGAISAALGDQGTSRSLTITAIAHQANWQDSTILSGVFNICGPGKWDSSNWDQATWQ